MDFLISSFTGLLLIVLFRYLEKKRIKKVGKTAYLFWLYVVLCSFFMKPSEEFILWLIFSLLLYSVFDDMKTKTLNIYFPIITTLLFFFFIEKPYFFLYSFVFFSIFLILTKLTKEKLIGEGDSYVLLPLVTLLATNLPSPHWLLFVEQTIYALLLSVLLVAVIAIPLKLGNQDISDLPFSPFLVLGTVMIYSGFPWVTTMISYLFLATALLYFIWLIKMIFSRIISYINEKKQSKNDK